MHTSKILKETINRAYNWLCLNMTSISYLGVNDGCRLYKPEFLSKFKSYMEDGQTEEKDKILLEEEPEAADVNFEWKMVNGIFRVVRKLSEYPTSYEECCDVLNDRANEPGVGGYRGELMTVLQKLIVCRDAWWQLYGDWEPDWKNDEVKYTIEFCRDEVALSTTWSDSCLFSFPDDRMRDKFYEAFQPDIRVCKDLLKTKHN